MTFTCQACFAEGAALQCSLCQHARYCSQGCQQQSPYHTSCSKSISSSFNAYQSIVGQNGSLVQGLQVGVRIDQVRNALKYLRSNSSEIHNMFKSANTNECLKPHRLLPQLHEFAVAIVQFEAYSSVDFPLLARQFGIRTEFETKGLATYRERFRSVAHTLRSFMHKFWPILQPNTSRAGRVFLMQIRNILEELLQGDALLQSTDLIGVSVLRLLNKLVRFVRDAVLDPLADKFSTIFAWLGRYLSAVLSFEAVHSTEAHSVNVQLGMFGTELLFEAFPGHLSGPRSDGDRAMFQKWLHGFRSALRTFQNKARHNEHVLNDKLLKERADLIAIDPAQFADLLDESNLQFFAESLVVSFLSGLSMVDTCRAIHDTLALLHHNFANDPTIQQVQADVAQVSSAAEAFHHPLLDELQRASASFNQTLNVVATELTKRLETMDRNSPKFREQQWTIVGHLSHYLTTGEPITTDETGIVDICTGKSMLMLASEYMRMVQLTYDIESDLTDDYYDHLFDSDDEGEEVPKTPQNRPSLVGVGPVVVRGRSPRRPRLARLAEQYADDQAQNLTVIINTANTANAATPGPAPIPAEVSNGERSNSRKRKKEKTFTSEACNSLFQTAGRMTGTAVPYIALLLMVIFATVAVPFFKNLSDTSELSKALSECQALGVQTWERNLALKDENLQYFNLIGDLELAKRLAVDRINTRFRDDDPNEPRNGAIYDHNFLNRDMTLNLELLRSVYSTVRNEPKDEAVRLIKSMEVNPASLVNCEETSISTQNTGDVVGLARFIQNSGEPEWIEAARERIKNQLESGKLANPQPRTQATMDVLGLAIKQVVESKLVGVQGEKTQFEVVYTKPATGDYTPPPVDSPEQAVNVSNPLEGLLNNTVNATTPYEFKTYGRESIYGSFRGLLEADSAGVRFAHGELPLATMLIFVAVILITFYWTMSNNPNAPRYLMQMRTLWLLSVGATAVLIVPQYLGFMDTATLGAAFLVKSESFFDTIFGGWSWKFGFDVFNETMKIWSSKFNVPLPPGNVLAFGTGMFALRPTYHMVMEITESVLGFFRGAAGAANNLHAITAPANPQLEQSKEALYNHQRLFAGQQQLPAPTVTPPASTWGGPFTTRELEEIVRDLLRQQDQFRSLSTISSKVLRSSFQPLF